MDYVPNPPASKRELLNRLTSIDFDGDLRHLGKGAQVSRVKPNMLELRFAETDQTFLLSVHIPRERKKTKRAKPTTRRVEDWD